MIWQNPGAQAPNYGLQQAMAAQAAQQQQLQQQQANFQVRAPGSGQYNSCIYCGSAPAGCYAMAMNLHGVHV